MASRKRGYKGSVIFSRFTVLALLTAAFYALSFPGYDVWPLSFIAFVPLLWILEDTATQFKNAAGWPEKKKILQRGFIWAWLAGFATHFGGHYWLVGMLERFSSFPLLLCVLLTTLLMAWQGLALACFALLWLALRTARWPLVWLTPVAWIVVEKLFPVLFDNYFSNTWHNLPLLVQTADLGGPLLLSFLALTINALAYEVLRRLIAR